MQKLPFDLEDIKRRIQAIQKSERGTSTNSRDSSPTEHGCQKCKDTGYIIKVWGGAGLATECKCLAVKRATNRLKSAMIPSEFERATFHDYHIRNRAQNTLYMASEKYLEDFLNGAIREDRRVSFDSLGFIAHVGEQRLREMPRQQQAEMKRRHNNFGLGKTHLQVAIAKELIKNGISVLIVSDVALMDELMSAKQMDDKNIYHSRVNAVIHASVLVWDDIGKAKPTEAKEAMYFHIINERYKAQRPILFSSNEDAETLNEKIGNGATSRLLSMAKGRLVRVEGPDYRLTRGEAV